MKIMRSHDVKKSEVSRFLSSNWGSLQIVLSGGIHQCDEQDGFLVQDHEEAVIALVTYVIKQDVCEITSLCSTDENKGIGTELMRRVEAEAVRQGCRRTRLTTTNDNLRALGFYQKRGYCLVEIIPGAVDIARNIKPEIPLLSESGIPIRDEIVLEKLLLPRK